MAIRGDEQREHHEDDYHDNHGLTIKHVPDSVMSGDHHARLSRDYSIHRADLPTEHTEDTEAKGYEPGLAGSVERTFE